MGQDFEAVALLSLTLKLVKPHPMYVCNLMPMSATVPYLVVVCAVAMPYHSDIVQLAALFLSACTFGCTLVILALLNIPLLALLLVVLGTPCLLCCHILCMLLRAFASPLSQDAQAHSQLITIVSSGWAKTYLFLWLSGKRRLYPAISCRLSEPYLSLAGLLLALLHSLFIAQRVQLLHQRHRLALGRLQHHRALLLQRLPLLGAQHLRLALVWQRSLHMSATCYGDVACNWIQRGYYHNQCGRQDIGGQTKL